MYILDWPVVFVEYGDVWYVKLIDDRGDSCCNMASLAGHGFD